MIPAQPKAVLVVQVVVKKETNKLYSCIETWKKFLPEYEIKLLDYQGVINYIGEDIFSNIICKNMTLPIQADAIRIALMKQYGGIWMDADTIITSPNFLQLFQGYDLGFFGNSQHKNQNIFDHYLFDNNSLHKLHIYIPCQQP